ncbi:hypothetical protein LRE06_11075 [Halorhodospira halophila]|nr:hypothetical protein [Halorhodospira halophila]MCG5544262.1 hypothetical protein [Halorhodospira sp. 9628]
MSDSRYPRTLRYPVLYIGGLPCYALYPWADRIRRPWWLSALAIPRRRPPGLFPVRTELIHHKTRRARWPETIKMWPWIIAWGDWDRIETMPASWEHDHIVAVLEGADYRQLPIYDELCQEIRQKGRTHLKGLESATDIDAYFSNIPVLADSIRQHGISPGRTHGAKEIQVRIGRDGTLLKCGEGTHRLAIARAVGIAEVPVQVELIHAAWAKRVIEGYDLPLIAALGQWFAAGCPRL